MTAEQLHIAYFQQDICWEDPQANFLKIERALASAISPAHPVDIIVVPETFSTGFSDNMARMAELPEGPSYQFAHLMASRYNAMFIGTWTLKLDNRVYNRLHWVMPNGDYGFYDKGHTFRMSSEASQLARGTQRKTFFWRGWRIRPAVCYDLRFPQWLRNKSKIPGVVSPLDYDLMVVCANWPGSRFQAWNTLLQARAIENEAYVLGVNRVGVDGTGIPYTGHSAAIDYKGQVISQCQPGEEQVQLVTLSKPDLDVFRQHWPFYLDAD